MTLTLLCRDRNELIFCAAFLYRTIHCELEWKHTLKLCLRSISPQTWTMRDCSSQQTLLHYSNQAAWKPQFFSPTLLLISWRGDGSSPCSCPRGGHKALQQESRQRQEQRTSPMPRCSLTLSLFFPWRKQTGFQLQESENWERFMNTELWEEIFLCIIRWLVHNKTPPNCIQIKLEKNQLLWVTFATRGKRSQTWCVPFHTLFWDFKILVLSVERFLLNFAFA